MRIRWRAAVFGLALPLAVACGPERLEKTEADVAAAITAAVARGDTATLRLFTEVPFAFDRLYIAGPRTAADVIAAAMRNETWIPEFSRGIENADHFHLLLFETRGRLVPAALPKRVADIAPELVGRMYVPEDAIFSVVRSAAGGAPTLAALPASPASAAPAPE